MTSTRNGAWRGVACNAFGRQAEFSSNALSHKLKRITDSRPLVGRIGADRAAYTSILFAIVALIISAVYEKYQLRLLGALDVACILTGNGLVLLQKRRISPEIRTRFSYDSLQSGP